jgi:hypothetical protein
MTPTNPPDPRPSEPAPPPCRDGHSPEPAVNGWVHCRWCDAVWAVIGQDEG